MKLTDRIVASVTLIVISAMFVLFIGGAISFRKLGTDFLSRYLGRVVEQIDQAVLDPREADSIEQWLPRILRVSDVIELDISSKAGLLFHYHQVDDISNPDALIENRFNLTNNPGFYVTIKSLPPYADFTHSVGSMFSITLAILIIFCGLLAGIRWLKGQLHGVDLLAHRSQLILSGRIDEAMKGQKQEWPQAASAALDMLLLELNDARQERCRFDTFLRSNMFLDKLTGVANRLLFDNRLQTHLQDKGCYGAVLLMEIHDWDDIKQVTPESEVNEFIMHLVDLLTNLTMRYSDVVLARYYDNQFAILLNNHSAKSARQFVSQLTKNLLQVHILPTMNPENWTCIGMSYFSGNESQEKLMQEVHVAKKSAKLQQFNAWHAFEKKCIVEDMRGSVRWRTLLNDVFAKKGVTVYRQTVVDVHQQPLHIELLARIQDERGEMIKASRFLKGVHLVGMSTKLDRAMLNNALTCLRKGQISGRLSVNLCTESLIKKEFRLWLRDTLMQTPRATRQRLYCEITESSLVQYAILLRPSLQLLKSLNVNLIIDKAGKSIVSTRYIKEVQPKYIKLHRSLIRDISHHPENQLYIRSLLGACESTETEVLAVGVELQQEWTALIDLGVKGGQGRLFSPDLMIVEKNRPKRQRWRRVN